jgi:transcriptional regulator GlxA family with amidase domain
MRALKAFMLEYEGRLPGYGTVLEGLGLEITHLIIRAVLDLPVTSERVEHRVGVDRVIQYLHSNYGEKVTVAAMADLASLSASHFARIFKEETGRSPFDYLLYLRLEKARKLLRAGDVSITETALQCGFNSPSHFTACFKKRYSLTPLKYKKSMAES